MEEAELSEFAIAPRTKRERDTKLRHSREESTNVVESKVLDSEMRLGRELLTS